MSLQDEIAACVICAEQLEQGVRPVVQIHQDARILIAGQAPGAAVHRTGVPFDDPSGRRLRDWLGVDDSAFYNANKFAILPMGFCYPGKGTSGDLPPRPECAPQWRQRALDIMPNIRLTILLGQYAQQWHLGDSKPANLTETVRQWREFWPHMLPLPHPSPRNNIWLKKNPWFEEDVLPALRQRVSELLATD